MALAVLPLVVDRLQGALIRNWALIAASLAATVFLPGALGDERIDTRPANVFAAAGVALTLCLTIAAARTGGSAIRWRHEPGDRIRLLIAAALLLCALPWIAAGWDLSLHLPVLRSLFLSDQLRAQPGVPGVHEAVHAGFHHGWAGVMLALTALLCSRALPYLSSARRRHLLALYLSFLLAYGLGNAVQDFQLEQIVKRGLMTYQLPMVLAPALNWAWALLLVAAAGVYALAFRPLARASSLTSSQRRLGLAGAARTVHSRRRSRRHLGVARPDRLRGL